MVGPNLPFGGLACGLVLGPLPSQLLLAPAPPWLLLHPLLKAHLLLYPSIKILKY